MAGSIEFWFDFSSPYGYLAAHKIEALAAKHGRTVDWHPMLLGAAFKQSGMAPLTQIPLKGGLLEARLPTQPRFHGVGRLPDARELPIPSQAARASCCGRKRAILPCGQGDQVALSRVLLRRARYLRTRMSARMSRRAPRRAAGARAPSTIRIKEPESARSTGHRTAWFRLAIRVTSTASRSGARSFCDRSTAGSPPAASDGVAPRRALARPLILVLRDSSLLCGSYRGRPGTQWSRSTCPASTSSSTAPAGGSRSIAPI
jgi:hypothetical protein